MGGSTDYNSSSTLPSDYFIRKEITRYMAEVNFTLAFVQSFVSLSGLLGNILALIIINRKSLRNTSSSVFINYMAIFDSTVLLLHVANLVQPRNLFIHCSLTYLTDLFTFCANWVLVIITLERCVAVSSPFLAKRFCTIHSARYSIYILLTAAIIFFSSTFPIMHDLSNSSKRKKCLIRPRYGLFYRTYQPIIFYGIPDILLLSNLFTVYTLFRRRKQQRRSTVDRVEMHVTDVHSNRKQRQLTIMLVTVNLAFYLFTTPALVLFITEYSPPGHLEIKKLKRTFLISQISVLFMQFHNATNFIFYCFAGQRFRQATIQTAQQCSNQLRIFYHRYIQCDKHYTLPINYQLKTMRTTPTHSRISYPQNCQRLQNRKRTI